MISSKATERLAVVRSPTGLTAVSSTRRACSAGAGRSPAPGSLYALERVPLDRDGLRRMPDLAELAAAWDRLRAATPHGAQVLADCLHVLVSTVPSAVRDAVRPLAMQKTNPGHHPTAAHPRAFRGTKWRPPRPAEPDVVDLRELLCSPLAVRRLLAALAPAWTEALRLLDRRRLCDRSLARHPALIAPRSDPYLAVHHDGAPTRASLRPAFVERLLPSLSGAPWSIVRRAAALFERLDLADDEALAALCARFARVLPVEPALAWWAAAATQPRERRMCFLALTLESGASVEDPARVPPEVLVDLGQRVADERYERWARATLGSLGRRTNPVYLATGIRWACDYAPSWSATALGDAPDFDAGSVELLARILPTSWPGEGLLALWESCGAVPGLATRLMRTDWSRFSEHQRAQLLRFFANRHGYDGTRAVEPRRWRAIEANLPEIERALRDAPPAYAEQLLNDLGEIIDGIETPAAMRDRLPSATRLLARLNRPPFDDDGNVAWPLGHLLALPEPHRGRVLASADASFRQLDRGCRRRNDATLIACGLSTLVGRTPALVADAFATAPGTLVRTARQLGILSAEARAELLARCLALPIFAADVSARAVPDLLALIDATGVANARGIVPRALREHFAGRRALSPRQIAGHHRALLERLASCRLAIVQAAVVDRLGRAIGARSVSRELLDALALLQRADENRRGLRRVLRAWLDGDTDYLGRHPATRAWAQRHPRVDLSLWTRGLERRCSWKGHEVTIRMERDALEVLKMGTYVGTCLGLGGMLSYSAAAVLLDVNKQVLYARDARGAVLARQLLAISDDDRLVAFAVYPTSTAPELLRRFDEYDAELATALGVTRVKPDDEYAVASVLSREWWDDGAWFPETTRTSPHEPLWRSGNSDRHLAPRAVEASLTNPGRPSTGECSRRRSGSHPVAESC